MSLNTINLKDCYCNGVKPAIAYEYEFYVNEDLHKVKKQVITGNELHELAGTTPDTHFIRMKTREGKRLVGPGIKVDLTECGIERFIILPFVQEKLDLNDCFCNGVTPYITYLYTIKVNREKFDVEQEEITGKEIVKLLGKDPEKNRVRMFTVKGKVIVNNDEKVDLTQCGVERFVVEPLDCTEGFIASTPFNQLLKEDLGFLSSFEKIDYLSEGNADWVVIRGLKLPEGYNLEQADAAVLLPKNYPAGHLDMIYFYPPLNRKDGKEIGALSSKMIENKQYQRWSRHRTQQNMWDPENDNLESHIDLMIKCLISEFKKR